MRDVKSVRGQLSIVCLFVAVAVAGQALVAMPAAAARPAAEDMFPTKADPFSGSWKGRWWEKEEVSPDIAAQVIPLGNDMYQIRLVSKLFMRCPVLAIIEAERKGKTLKFDDAKFRGVIKGDTFTGGRRTGKATFEMKRFAHESPTMGAAAPAGSLVLFDGSNLDQWDGTKGWIILEDGTLMVTPEGKELTTKQPFKDCKLHVEFRTPLMSQSRGQQRGNSGVSLQGTYEVQILDSYGLEGYYNECGALYKVSAPRVNACAPPLDWQTYDITYRAPRFDGAGTVAESPRITVIQNGICIQDNREMPWITGWKEKDRLRPAPRDPGPIKLQGHHNFVQFRNVWLVDLGEAQ